MYTLTQEQVNELANGKKIQDVLPDAFTLEVGKWYKDPSLPLRLVFIEELIKPKGSYAIKGYGFDGDGDWAVYSNGFYAGAHNLYLATREEVDAMLIAEAKKRGFVKGANVKGVGEFTYSGVLSLSNCLGQSSGYKYHCNKLVANISKHRNAVIFENGQWAEIVTESNEDIVDSDIATIEQLHDVLLDNHKYDINSKLLTNARDLASKLRKLCK